MDRAFVDTSAWLAFIDPDDPQHRAIEAAIRRWKGRLVTSNFVFDETITMCRVECGHAVAVRVADRLSDGRSVQLVRITQDDEAEALRLLRRRADKEYSFTDCTSFVLMRRMALKAALSVDDDFRQEGLRSEP